MGRTLGTAWCKAMSRIVCTELAMYKFIGNCLHLAHLSFFEYHFDSYSLLSLESTFFLLYYFVEDLPDHLFRLFVTFFDVLCSDYIAVTCSASFEAIDGILHFFVNSGISFMLSPSAVPFSSLSFLLRLLCSFTIPFHHRRRTAFWRIHQRHWQFLFVMSQLHHSRCFSLE